MSKEKLIPDLRFPEFKNSGDWLVGKAGERSEIIIGGTPSTTIEEYWGGEIGWIGSGELKNGIIKYPTKYITKIGLEKSSTQILPKGTPVLAMTGATLGKIGLLDFDCCGNQSVAGFVKLKNLDSIFLYHQLQKITKQILSFAGGGAQAGINKSNIENLKLLIPDIGEQKKIASCLSSLDEVIAAHSQKLDLLKEHKKGLMQNLFPQEGEKVPKFRFKEFEKDGEWVEEILYDVINYFKGFAFQSKDYTSKGRRIIRVSDMSFDYIKNEENAIYINEGDAVQYEKWQLKKDDIIITTVGSKPPMYDSLVGRTIIVESKDENALLNQNAVCLRANSKIAQGFLNNLFKKNDYVTFIESIIRGNANQGSIALEDLFKYKFLQPNNTKEQQKIAFCLSSLDELIKSQAEKVEQLKLHKKGLMQGLFPKIQE